MLAGMSRRIALAFLLVGCGGRQAAPPPAAAPAAPELVTPAPVAEAPDAAPAAKPKPEARQLEEDTPARTASGATFIAPKGWFLTDGGEVTLLEDPDRQLS